MHIQLLSVGFFWTTLTRMATFLHKHRPDAQIYKDGKKSYGDDCPQSTKLTNSLASNLGFIAFQPCGLYFVL